MVDAIVTLASLFLLCGLAGVAIGVAVDSAVGTRRFRRGIRACRAQTAQLLNRRPQERELEALGSGPEDPSGTGQDSWRPTWTWTNDLRKPSTIRVEPSFRDELGLVFVGIGEWAGDSWSGNHNGIWLGPDQVRALRRALSACAAWAEEHGGEDDE